MRHAFQTLLLLTCVTSAALSAEDATRPNVLLIMTDDQGWFDLGCHGNPAIETPTMDRLANEGVEFTRFYACPVCTPTRASLMTGRYYHRTRAIDTYMGRDTLDAGEITLGQIFQQAGYRTGQFGKWHLGRYMKYHPNERGFNDYFGFWQYGFINRYDDSDELWDNKQPVITTGYVTDVLTDQAIRFIRENRQRPFFCYVPYNAPHSPHLVPDPFIDRYLKKGLPLREARIYGMVTSIDENIARLLATLDELKLSDDTLVIFMTDNGGVSHFYKAGLRGNKGSVYEGGVRVPLMLRWPKRFAAGLKIDAMAMHLDLLPTLCELIGAREPDDRVIDGRSLMPLIRAGGGASPHDYIFHQWNRVVPKPSESWAVYDGRYKLANGELFDLQEDPGESKNLAAGQPERVAKLREVFLNWFKEVTDRTYQRVPIEVGRADENPVELDITWADPIGTTIQPRYRNYNRDATTNWSVEGEGVRWKIEVVTPGTYDVLLEYGCLPGNAGSSFTVRAGGREVRGSVEATPGTEVYVSFPAGSIELSPPDTSFEIVADKIVGKDLMGLHKVWLKRRS